MMRQTRRMLFMAAGHVAANPFHAECLKAKQKLRDAPDKTLAHSVLLKRMKMDALSFQPHDGDADRSGRCAPDQQAHCRSSVPRLPADRCRLRGKQDRAGERSREPPGESGEGRRTKGEGSFEGKDWKYTCFSSSFSLSALSEKRLALDSDAEQAC
ncbi:MAG: hypothetical protein R3B90_00355 [Planctomycetaceae bacterium]